jgi:hypothetical protein
MLMSPSPIRIRCAADLWSSAAILPSRVLPQRAFRSPIVVGIPRGTEAPAPRRKMTGDAADGPLVGRGTLR